MNMFKIAFIQSFIDVYIQLHAWMDSIWFKVLSKRVKVLKHSLLDSVEMSLDEVIQLFLDGVDIISGVGGQ